MKNARRVRRIGVFLILSTTICPLSTVFLWRWKGRAHYLAWSVTRPDGARREAVLGLMRSDPDVGRQVLPLLLCSSDDDWVVLGFEASCQEVGTDETIAPFMERGLQHSNWLVRRAALKALVWRHFFVLSGDWTSLADHLSAVIIDDRTRVTAAWTHLCLVTGSRSGPWTNKDTRKWTRRDVARTALDLDGDLGTEQDRYYRWAWVEMMSRGHGASAYVSLFLSSHSAHDEPTDGPEFVWEDLYTSMKQNLGLIRGEDPRTTLERRNLVRSKLPQLMAACLKAGHPVPPVEFDVNGSLRELTPTERALASPVGRWKE